MRGCPVIIAVFQIGPHAFPLQSPCGFSREGRKEGGVRDCLLQRVQMPGYYFLIAPPGVLAYPGIFHLQVDCLPRSPPATWMGQLPRQG